MPKSSVDPDAQAFITAAAITDPTQQQAINTLVVDLKGYGIWSKMKAIYPFVGGTAAQHKWNLKDPRDLDAAFRLVFLGGWTHSVNGALPNGTNGAANTYLAPSLLTNNNTHLSVYSRTDSNGTFCDLGVSAPAPTYIPLIGMYPRDANNFAVRMYDYTAGKTLTSANTNSQGFYIGNRTSSTVLNNWKNGVKQATVTYTNTDNVTSITQNIHLSSINLNGALSQYSNRQLALISIGDGLTDTDAANFYTSVQAFQTTLGRSIGTQVVSDPDAQAFINAANIQDQVEATAINNLTIGLKADGLWTKMKAVYPFVGGTAASHKFNLKNPLDTDAAFRLVFNGGWTHSSTGATPNGTNAYADSKLIPSSVLTLNNTHLSFYSRTSAILNNQRDIAVFVNGDNPSMSLGTNTGVQLSDSYSFTTNRISTSIINALGFVTGTRISSTSHKLFKSGLQIGSTDSVTNILTLPSQAIYLGAANQATNTPNVIAYSTKQVAFASIGDGLTDTEAANLYSRVQTFQTTLSRNV